MSSPLNYTGGLTLSCQCKDRKKSAKWYTDVLGFQLLYDVEQIGWCELATETKGVNIGLSEVESPKVGAGPVPTFAPPFLPVGPVLAGTVIPTPGVFV